jgi:hypothetical protein
MISENASYKIETPEKKPEENKNENQ